MIDWLVDFCFLTPSFFSTACSRGHNLSKYPQFNNVNSQASEQSNAGLKRIKDQLSYMTEENFMTHCQLYMYNQNTINLSKINLIVH